MAYFPAFVKLDERNILIIGGGHIAYEKLEHLLDFTHNINIIAQNISPQMQRKIEEYSLTYSEKAYQEGDIKEFDIVIIAVNDIKLQAAIYEESKAYKCLCNAVDSVDYCDFIFPSYIKKGDLTLAVSTSGASPAVAKHFKRYLLKKIPDSIVSFLQEMKQLRSTLPKGTERMQQLDKKAENYFKELSHDH